LIYYPKKKSSQLLPRGYSSIFSQYKTIPAGIAAACPVVVSMAISSCNNKYFFRETKQALTKPRFSAIPQQPVESIHQKMPKRFNR
jgi:hypothetical protein